MDSLQPPTNLARIRLGQRRLLLMAFLFSLTLSDEQLSHKGIIPSGLFSFPSDTACGRTAVDQIDGDFSQKSKIVPSMVFPDSGRIFLKRDIQHPMQTVFYRPVLAYCGYLPLIFAGQAGEEKTLFCPHSSIWFDQTNRFHRHDAFDSRPCLEHGQLRWRCLQKHPTTGETAMPFVKGIQYGLQRSRHRKGMLFKPGFHRLQGPFLIPFHSEHIVGLLVENRLGDGFLAADSVDGDQSTGESQTSEQSRNGRHLVGFAVHR